MNPGRGHGAEKSDYYIWPARLGYTQCYAYPYYTGPWIPITSFAACNPQTLY
jgi:hypothetical protein